MSKISTTAISSLFVVAIAVLVSFLFHKKDNGRDSQDINEEQQKKELWIIGDLHGDSTCAKFWVNQINLIENFESNNPDEWRWKNPNAQIVFLGDYIDKGPTSKQTLKFIKTLKEKFPLLVNPIMGNHELELLRDRESYAIMQDDSFYFQYVYATVHPAEYLNYVEDDQSSWYVDFNMGNSEMETVRINDDFVVDALYNASLKVYEQNLYGSFTFAPRGKQHQKQKKQRSIIDLVEPPSIANIVSDRLELYQNNYIKAYGKDTELGKFIGELEIMHFNEEFQILFVHGGMRDQVANYLFQQKQNKENVNAGNEGGSSDDTATSVAEIVKDLNEEMHHFANYDDSQQERQQEQEQSENFLSFLSDTIEGQIIYDLVTYRGNHNSDRTTSTTCNQSLNRLLDGKTIEGVTKLAVGHTPGNSVRIGSCVNNINNNEELHQREDEVKSKKSAFLAVDSSLGRHFRAFGNMYCNVKNINKSDGEISARTNRREKAVICPEMNSWCEGEIVRITHEEGIQIMNNVGTFRSV